MTEKNKPEIMVFPSKKVTNNPDLFKALMQFQYGEAEESDKGFEKMKKILEEKEEKNG